MRQGAAVSTRSPLEDGISFATTTEYRRGVRFRVLGPIEVSHDGSGPIPLGGPKQRSVLAHLLLRANHLVPTETLIDEVWGDEQPEAVRNALQTYASHLRKALGSERLEGSRAGYVLSADPSEVDAFRFQSLLRDARRLLPIEPKAAIPVFDEALGLWRGPAFADLAGERSLLAESARLDELRLSALEDRADALITVGRHAEVIGDLEALTKSHPLRERLWAQLILGLYRAGRQGEALAAFEHARQVLADELGVDPSPDLRRLHEQILRQSPELEIAGQPLRGYRLLERVGAGTSGAVWRALQPEVGRDVAIKAIHPHLANDPDFIRRFEAEAQIVARIEHPHVVPLYDYWREPGGAYLVMRYVRGGNLADAIAKGPFDVDRAAALLDEIGGALAAAAGRGVTHRDVKPSNILLDEEGNAYLADFGIAKDASATEQAEPGLVKGSLAYLAPEQIGGEAVTPRADLYSLGVVLYEVLVGEHPFEDVPDLAIPNLHLHEPIPSARARRHELPPAVDAVIATATAKDPAERFADGLEMANAFRRAIAAEDSAGMPPRESSIAIRNPYKGLRPFTEADAQDFFGREAFVGRLLERWRRPDGAGRLLVVVGPSGSGKSSTVLAGLIPALRSGGADGSAGWFITEMVPGHHPMEELEAALLRVAVNPPAGLLQLLESGPRGLLDAVDRVVPEGTEVVLVIDQFEELFTLTETEAERSLLLESLRVAVADPGSRVRIVATLRGDFYDRPLNYQRFGDLLGTSTEVVTALAPHELERAIVGPTEPLGLGVEPALVAQVASDVAEQPGALPLVQYALTELFERREDGRLTLAAYRDIGGVSGALAARAEHLYAIRDSRGREAVRQLFLHLVTLEEGAPDTRRRVPQSELAGLEVDSDAMHSTLDAFGRHRLLTFDRDPATREPTVEVAHEALLRAWPRLHGWIDAAREDLRTLRRLADATGEWTRNDREPSFLLAGSRLDQLETWSSSTSLALGHGEREYLRASVARRERSQAAEETRVARERVLKRRSVTRLRAFVAVLAVGIIVAGTLTSIAVGRNATAQRFKQLAFARELAGAATANLDADRELAILLALESIRVNDGVALPQVEDLLRGVGTTVAIDTSQVLSGGVSDIAFTRDGSRALLLGGDRYSLGVWDLSDGHRALADVSPCGDAECPLLLLPRISDDGSVVTVAAGSSLRGWNLATGRAWAVGPVDGVGGVYWFDLSRDGSRLAYRRAGAIRVRFEDGTEKRLLDDRDVDVFAFTPDGTGLLFAQQRARGDLGVVDVETGRTDVLFTDHTLDGGSASADGSRVALMTTGPSGSEITVWDLPSVREIASAPARNWVVGAVSPDGGAVALSDSDSVVLLDGQTLSPLRTIGAAPSSELSFSPGGDQIATISAGRAGVWDVRSGTLVFAPPPEDPIDAVSAHFNADGSAISVVYSDGRILGYPIAFEEAIAMARSRVTRSLTDEECRQYLHVPGCPSP
jgi:DNA-binding SARP family transcriptional activator/WD40 repeat protein